MFRSYLKIAQKRVMMVFMKSIRYFFCAFILLGICVWACSMAFQDRQVLQRIDVAVVVPEENAQALEFLTDLVSAMKSVKSVCHFEYMKEDRALEELKSGDMQAVLVFSKHLYRDLDLGRNTSVQLYVAQETSTSVQMFQELLKDGISMIWTAEAGVYAVLDQAQPGTVNPEYDDIGMQVAMYYLQIAFDRNYIFDDTVVSPYGAHDQKEYYYSTGVLWVLLLMGMGFASLYQGDDRAIESKLRMYGIWPIKVACANIVAMTNIMLLITGAGYLIGCIFTRITQGTFLVFDMRIPVGLFFLCLTFAVWYHVVFALTKRSGIGILALIACEGILALGSGLIVPIAYLPKRLRAISVWLPLYQWNQCSMNLFFGTISWWEIGCLGVWLLLGGMIGVIAVCEKQ